jgi:hypothetical protein
MLRRLLAWARAEGWEEVRAGATRHIPPLLAWSGMLSREAYGRLGFACAGVASHDALEGVVHMRAGGHGEDVRLQWAPFAHLSDEEASETYDMTLFLGTGHADGQGTAPE